MSQRAKLLLLILLMASPLLAAYAAHYVWRPTRSTNYGDLLPATRLPLEVLQSVAGGSAESIQGKWVLLSIDSGSCDAACAQKLYFMRQVRTAQGKNMQRVARAFMTDDDGAGDPKLIKEYEGTLMLKRDSRILAALPARVSARNHIYLIDPLGNLVLRYPARPDAKRMMKDLTRLLSVSQIG